MTAFLFERVAWWLAILFLMHTPHMESGSFAARSWRRRVAGKKVASYSITRKNSN
ncbi:MAG: hypothetical protein LUH20_08500 [Lachnospiraceae bacterium]|nr:hypothetical protein [Lachnospiraceae bacterium]